jgi:hypothetical protein
MALLELLPSSGRRERDGATEQWQQRCEMGTSGEQEEKGKSVSDMPKSPSSQYGLKDQEDIDPRVIRVTNGPMR